MVIYFLLSITLLYGLFLSRVTVVRNINTSSNEFYVARSNITLFFWFMILLGLAAFKGVEVGVDYPMYYSFFLNKAYIDLLEPGVSFIYELAVKYDNFYVFSVSVYFAFLFFIFLGIKKNLPNYLISLLFFILTYTYLNSYNQIRQMIAVSIIFCFVNYLLTNNKGDRLKYIIVIFLALLFHNSVIFTILLFFIPKKKFNSKLVIPLFLLTIVLYFLPGFKNMVGDIIINISGIYAEKYTTNLDFFFEVNKDKGILQLIPVIIQMIIVSISLYFPEDEKDLKINYKLYHFSTNLVIVNLWLYSLAGIEAIDRIQIYFSCFNLYYYPILIHLLLNSKRRFHGLFVILIAGFWILYFALRLYINIAGVVPYRLFIS
ncbi:EpsG family protein [Bacillus sp. S/N-304-OC-R1]|uniref:EpsG family protein n=1 Tax=Bacillus sp. S/N-304-OC-R1 TaxID=2758034 RepID=UPI001C8D6ECC|nr:EpsG family protein [Bacillus sp. S/N-304-OC-R1]MBY0124238.1 EpsG family protein [Bacillus sp. S/N-304-OC-R1]